MSRKKCDFRGPREARQYVYKIIEKLEKGDITAAVATAQRGLVDTWLKCYNVQATEELEQRIAEIEKALAVRSK